MGQGGSADFQNKNEEGRPAGHPGDFPIKYIQNGSRRGDALPVAQVMWRREINGGGDWRRGGDQSAANMSLHDVR